ncbi:MAG TPA: hypothetical protein VGM88_03410 [Kofleriaceae bacterium]|jgi:hypothetical protein
MRLILWLIVIGVLIWAAVSVPLGKKTLVEHVRAIWNTPETKDLRDGVREKAAPAVDRIERGAKAGYEAATHDDSATPDAAPDAAPAHP